MQNFILIILVLGLAFFLYLLQTDQISKNNFNISKFKSDAYFEIRKSDDIESKSSDIYVVVKGVDYKIFNFTGDDFKKLIKADYPQNIYKIPLEAKDAISGKWIGNRYVFYILEKTNTENNNVVYEIYKTEYPTDDVSKLQYYLIKSIDESDLNNKTEVRY